MREVLCHHCSTPFLPSGDEKEFCCAGCRYVHHVLLGEGLDVQNRPFEPHNLDWLKQEILDLPKDENSHRLRLRISGMTCVGCVWLIEKLFLRHKGAIRVHLFPATAEAEFIWDSDHSPLLELATELPRYGYALTELGEELPQARESQRVLPRLGLCAAFAMNTMGFTLPRYLGMDDDFAFAKLFDLIALCSATFSMLVGGTYFFTKAWTGIKHRSVHIDLPISLGLLFAYLGSLLGWVHGALDLYYFDFVALFTTLMLGGRYLHLTAAERSQNQLQGKSALPKNVTLLDGNTKATHNLRSGDQFTIHPGQATPAASRLIITSGEFSLAWMTGEPDPRKYSKGAIIPSGAISLSSEEVSLEATENQSESLVAQLMNQAEEARPNTGINRLLTTYLISILIIGFGSFLAWLALGRPLMDALQTMISIFVISCPCAIGVAIPLVDRRVSAFLAEKGIFIQKNTIWKTLPRIKHVIFDKTGTLTLETPALLKPEELDTLTPEARHALFHLSANSLHPLSRSLHQLLRAKGELPPPPDSPISEHPGLGTEYGEWTLGKPGWGEKSPANESHIKALSCELRHQRNIISTFHFQESLRPETRNAISALQHKLRLVLHILSGDQEHRVHQMAHHLEIPTSQTHGNLTPEEKKNHLAPLHPCLYLGDGMNDRPAFHASDITGTPVADRSLLDQNAHFLFTCASLNFLPSLFSLAQWRKRIVTQIVAFSITYNTLAIYLCLTGLMTPLLAAILMPISSILSLLIARTPIQRIRKSPQDTPSHRTAQSAVSAA